MLSNPDVPGLPALPSFIQGATLTAGKRGEVCLLEASRDYIAHYRGGSKAIIFARPEWGNFDTLSTRLQLVLDWMGRLGWSVQSTESSPSPHDGGGGPHLSSSAGAPTSPGQPSRSNPQGGRPPPVDGDRPMWRQITLQMK
jgi:hypothetical protein